MLKLVLLLLPKSYELPDSSIKMSMMSKKNYYYKAVMASGEIVTGEIAATSSSIAASLLQQRSLTPLRIHDLNESTAHEKPKQHTVVGKRKSTSFIINSDINKVLKINKRSASTRDLVMFSQDLSALLEAGVPLPRSLKIVAELIEKKRFEAVVLDLHEQIKEGSTFWNALEKHPSVFAPVFVNMVKAGEAGGVLDTVLARLGTYLDGVQELKEYFFSAMMYPMFLLITAAGSVAVLLAVVVPKFAVIFSDMGIALPLSTQIMLVVGTFLQSYWWLVIIGMTLVFFLYRFYASTTAGRYSIDRFKLRIPVLGTLFKKIEISRFCRTFGTLLNSGVPILSSLQMVRGVLSNVVLNASVENVYQQLKQGGVLSESLSQTGHFPTMAVQMIGIGEETGRMDAMLMRVADMYDREIKVNIKAFTSLFEPLIILLMGLVIGAMVISMLLAIFSVNDLGF